jgi:hypothetical protein
MAKNTRGIAEIAKKQNKKFNSIERLYEKFHGRVYRIMIGEQEHLIDWNMTTAKLYNKVQKLGIDSIMVRYDHNRKTSKQHSKQLRSYKQMQRMSQILAKSIKQFGERMFESDEKRVIRVEPAETITS